MSYDHTNNENMVALSNNEDDDLGILSLSSDDDTDGRDGGGHERLSDPFGELGVDLTESELRETAYEILIGVCRVTDLSKHLTYLPSSKPPETKEEKIATAATTSPTLHLPHSTLHLPHSVRLAAKSKLKKALGLKPHKKDSDTESEASPNHDSVSQDSGGKKDVTVGEMMKIQMRISEQIDSRVRRALLRVAAGQLERPIESIVLPLELLKIFKPTDFPNQQAYESWQRRHLKILEVGLVLHPHLPLDKTDSVPQQFQQIIQQVLQKNPIDTESMQKLQKIVTSLAYRSFDESISETPHWADSPPLNLKLYKILLEASFDVKDEIIIIEEVDELLEYIKKTWVVLGINQMFHNLCFLWVLFKKCVNARQIEFDLIHATENMLLEVEKDVNETKEEKDSAYFMILNTTLNLIIDWGEKLLCAYHDTFYRGNIETMQSVLSLVLTSAKILQVERGGVDTYIRSSLRNAFSQVKEKTIKSQKDERNGPPSLSALAINMSDLAFNEKEIYSPILKQWYPLATGVAVATIHSCYAKELKNFISSVTELTPDAIQVLIGADKLEKDLVQLAVKDSVDSEDGGKGIIQEMIPYETENVLAKLVKSWISIRVERLKEWVERNLQLEKWDPKANKERFAPSAVEVLLTVDEALEAFFLLPIPMHPALLPELLFGLDECIQSYISKTVSGCGSRDTFVPVMPPLTRCVSSKLDVFSKIDKSRRRKSQSGTGINLDQSSNIPELCTRINTIYYLLNELTNVTERVNSHLKKAACGPNINSGKFESSSAACTEGIQQLSEGTAYKVVFHDLSHLLWDSLYIGDVSSSRIEPFLDELEKNLEIISVTVHDKIRTQVITDVMKASFEGFSLVLLAGGPLRAFTVEDTSIIEEDFKFLTDLFWVDGDGLPSEIIDKCSVALKDVVTLLYMDSVSLVEKFKQVTYGGATPPKSKLPLPETSGQWSQTDPNTILRVLCHKNDKIASKFLKKTYNLPKRL